MNLKHLNLCVSDVPGLADLVCRHFGFESLHAGQVPSSATESPLPPGSHFAVLRGVDGFSLILTEPGPGSPTLYPTDFHLGFTVSTAREVVAKHAELAEAGLTVTPLHSFHAMGSTWTSFFLTTGDIRIEINAHG